MQGDHVSHGDKADITRFPTPPPTGSAPADTTAPGASPGASWIRNLHLRLALIWAASIATAAALWPVVFNVRAIESFIFFYHIDSDVYRAGAQAFLDGLNLYEQDYVVGGIQLPFTYPPIAAVVFTPLLLVPSSTMGVLLTLLSAVLMWWCIAIVLRRVIRGISTYDSRLFALFILPAALFTEPVNQTLQFGQINILLMTLVLMDTFTRKPWLPRGFWIGLAAAIKLTPAVFGLYFLVKRDWKGAITSIASGVGFTLLAFALLPSSSVQYWTETLSDPSRIGNLSYITNQSIRGMFSRLMHERQDVVELIWMASVVLVLIGVTIAMVRVLRAGSVHGTVLLNSLIALLCSPVSWSHHWVWLIPITLGFAAGAWSQRDSAPRTAATSLTMALVTTVPMLIPTFWNMPFDSEAAPAWPLLLHPSGSSYVVVAIATVIVCLVNPRVLGTGQPVPGQPVPGHAAVDKASVDKAPTTDARGVNPALTVTLLVVSAYLAINAWYKGENGNVRLIQYPRAVLDGLDLTSFGYLVTEPLRTDNLVALWVIGALNIVSLIWCAVVIVQRLANRVPTAFTIAVALTIALLSEPVQSALQMGSLTLVVLALILTDLVAPRSVLPRGLLTGLTAGITGWPVLIIVALFLQRRVRAAVTAALTAVVLWVVGWLLAPSGRSTLLDVQTTVHDGADNASLAGFLARWISDSPVIMIIWVVIALAVGAWAVYHTHATGDVTLSATIAIAWPAIALPTVYAYMWVLFIPLVVLLLTRGRVFSAFLWAFIALVNWVPVQVSYDTHFPLNHRDMFDHVGLAGSYLLVEPLTIAPAAIGLLLVITAARSRQPAAQATT
ncbi:hypothetical protein HMPREF0290_2110 [Corynebacterium efficiens YS-314]|nr:glycosyltransferase 87 family protein [Corynebacterium efficiens]EEW49291.1 hypothetical protein HMPREF0290_2110 [Corynebacterium efficiens YS-314]